MGKRVALDRGKLVPVLKGWLRRAPAWVWGKEPGYEKLRAQKRHDPSAEPDPKRIVAELIAEEIDRLGWEVSYESKRDIFSDEWSMTAYKGPSQECE